MNRRLRGLIFTIPGLVLGAVGGFSCNKLASALPDVCGPCGTLATGDYGISGDARLDGFFSAVGTLSNATASIKGDFDANIAALASLYPDINISAGISDTVVQAVIDHFKAEITAQASGGLKIDYQPPVCKASIDVAVSAEAKCEAKAKCDVKANPGQISVDCKGECSGGCDAACTGSAKCSADAPSIACTGSCEGSCKMDVAAACTGTCHGTCSGNCDGTCSAHDAAGKCTGQCDGKCDANCQGSCEISGGASCTGTCTGKCVTDSGGAKCTGNAECHGSCGGKCTGSCTGTATPPSASANCSASADCQASASAQGSASLDCSPPSLKIDFALNATTTGNASAQATFVAHMAEFKARGAAIVQGASRLKLLVSGDTTANIPSALGLIQGQVKGFASADAFAKFDVPAGRIECVVKAVPEAVAVLGSMLTDLGGTISGQAKFVAFITTGK